MSLDERKNRDRLLILPTLLMTAFGICLVPAGAMVFDAPGSEVGTLRHVASWMMMLTAPVGFATLGLSLCLCHLLDRCWLQLNAVVAGIYLLGFLILLLLIQWRPTP